MDREELKLLVQDGIKLNRDKALEVQNLHKTKGEWEAKQQSERTQRWQQETQVITQEIEKIRPNIPEANRKEVPANATPEQRKAIEEHNAFVKTVEDVFDNALYPSDPTTRAQVALAAAGAVIFERRLDQVTAQLAAKDTEIVQLKEKYNQLKGAGKTSPLGGAVPKVGATKTESERLSLKNEDAVEQGLQEAGL
jgi:hypothetical protein